MIRRDATPAEVVDFIRQTWERSVSAKESNANRAKNLRGDPHVPFGRAYVQAKVFAQARRHLIRSLLSQDSTQVEVLDVEGMVMGWVAWEVLPAGGGTLLHFVYVVPSARNKGLGRQLLQPLIEQGEYTCSHMTPAGKGLLEACTR